MKTLTRVASAVAVAASFGLALAAQAAATFYSPGGVAIKGYDTVAYFVDGKPVKGSDKFATDWMGAKWQFVSQANLDQFKADPVKYAPQYGGYCAYGTAKGHLAPTEPAAFAVIDGKLYLNYNERVRTTWTKDVSGYNKAADAAFPGLLKGPAEAE